MTRLSFSRILNHFSRNFLVPIPKCELKINIDAAFITSFTLVSVI